MARVSRFRRDRGRENNAASGDFTPPHRHRRRSVASSLRTTLACRRAAARAAAKPCNHRRTRGSRCTSAARRAQCARPTCRDRRCCANEVGLMTPERGWDDPPCLRVNERLGAAAGSAASVPRLQRASRRHGARSARGPAGATRRPRACPMSCRH